MQASVAGRWQVVCRSSAISSRRGCRAQWVTVQHGGGRSVNSPNLEGYSGFTTALAVALRQAEVAEAVAVERDRTIEALRGHVRALEAGPVRTPATPSQCRCHQLAAAGGSVDRSPPEYPRLSGPTARKYVDATTDTRSSRRLAGYHLQGADPDDHHS